MIPSSVTSSDGSTLTAAVDGSVLASGKNPDADTYVLNAKSPLAKITGIRLEDLYNKMLAKGWTLGAPQLLTLVHGVIRLNHKPAVRLLEEYWKRTQPEMVVSLVPNLNRALYESLRVALPGAPFVNILTDLADYPDCASTK